MVLPRAVLIKIRRSIAGKMKKDPDHSIQKDSAKVWIAQDAFIIVKVDEPWSVQIENGQFLK